MFSKLEVQVDDKCLTIWYGGHIVWRMWVTQDNQLHGRVWTERVDMSELQPPMSGGKRLEVHVLTKQEKEDYSMALPRLVSQRLEDDTVIRPAERRSRHQSTGIGGPLIDQHEVSNVLLAVLDSVLMSQGDDSKKLQALESRRIAAQENVGVGSVAAVRANFTRGRYGDPETMLNERLSWLTRNDPERLRGMIDTAKGATA